MTSSTAVYRPGRGTWLFYAFITLLLLFNSLFWFFDPVPIWVKFFGGAILLYWAVIIVGLARARLELREDTIEIFSPSYDVRPSREGAWLYWVLLLFVAFDVVALVAGPLPRWLNQARLALRFLWLAAYLLNLLQRLESGRRSIPYSAIEQVPFEGTWGRGLYPKRAVYMRIANDPDVFRFPPWLAPAELNEIEGRIAARAKHAHAGHGTSPEPAPEPT